MENRSAIRKANQKAIVEHIISSGGASRADIAKSLGLSKPAVSENVAELLDKRILFENGIAESPVGKKGTRLQFNQDYGYVMVLDLTGHLYENEITVSICDLGYHEKFLVNIPISTDNVADMIQEIQNKIAESTVDFNKVQLIVTAVSGIMKSTKEELDCYDTITPFNINQQLEQGFQKKVAMFNDINLAALGEYHLSSDTTKENLAYLWIDLAIGAGLILDGRLYEGHIGAAGEIGDLKTAVLQDGTLTYQKLSNILGIYYINEKLMHEAMQSTYLAKQLEQNGKVDFQDLLDGYDKGDSYCVDYSKQLMETVARLVYELVGFIDVEHIAIGGHINLFGEALYQTINETLKDLYRGERVTVCPPQSNRASVVGGHYVGVSEVIDSLFILE